MVGRTTKILSLCAEGPFAMFTVPAFKVEKVSYDVMTATSARGIVQAINWKPAVEIDIERIVVCNPIRRSTMTVNGVSKKVSAPQKRHFENPDLLIQNATSVRQQARHTMLLDVRYVIYFRYYLTDRAGPTETPIKFETMFEKRLRKGQFFRLPHFGMQQHIANCRPPTKDDVPLENESRDLGSMPHYRIYGDDHVETLWFQARLDHGVVEIPSRRERERARVGAPA